MRFDLSQPVPLLLVGDGPDSTTGLGRIGHDLAWLASSMPDFQVGYLGRGAMGRARFPWVSYCYPASGQWGEDYIERAWDDLAGNRRGVIMTIWDASRLLWFADPRGIPQESFLRSGRFEKWAYLMADAAGVNPFALPEEQAHVVSQYDRAAMASQFAMGLAARVKGPDLDWLPHPINREVYKPMGRVFGRSAFGVRPNETLIGCVMTNQSRKHWPTVMEAITKLSGKPRLWIHTDLLSHYWDIRALTVEYGLVDQVIYEGRALSDTEMAMRYSACDVTVVISGGEGFGYPVAESLSCGVPVLTGFYGAQAELTKWRVDPVTTIIDTSHNVRRAIYDAQDVARELSHILDVKPSPDDCCKLVEHLNMAQLGLVWQKWFRRGLVV